jgi:sortase A
MVAAALAVTWGAARGVGWASEQRALAAFRLVEHGTVMGAASIGPALPAAVTVDQRLWDPGRIRAYARALTRPAPPPMAVLRIPRLGLEVPVLEGTDEWTLDRAVGHIEGTDLPGQPGNVGIAGHRDGFFRVLKDISEGDRVELALPGSVRLYRVRRLSVVGPDEVSVLARTAEGALTLVTCYPFYFVGPAPRRFIVQALAE